jgi:uncharacterized protein (DUF1778 family)
MNTAQKRRRGRPRKTDEQKKGVDLRIPVTPDQKDLVNAAVQFLGEDMASWARPILIQAAIEVMSKARDGE